VYQDFDPDNPLTTPLLEGANAVLHALDSVFITNKNERLFNLEVSAGFENMLFDFISSDTASSLYALTTSAINRFEPRASLDHSRSRITPNQALNGYDVILYIKIKGYTKPTVYKKLVKRLAL